MSQLCELHTPGLQTFLDHLEDNFHSTHSVLTFLSHLKRRSISGPTNVAIATVQLLLRVVSAHRFTSVDNLVSCILALEKQLAAAMTSEMAVRNMVRRVVGIIKEEAENNHLGEAFKSAIEAHSERPKSLSARSIRPGLATTQSVTALFHQLSSQPASAAPSPPGTGIASPTDTLDLRPPILQDIQELLEEIESSASSIADSVLQLIHNGDTILTYGLTPTVHSLLLRAAHKKLAFTLIVVEGSPAALRNRTHGLAMNKLSEENQEEASDTDKKSLQERGIHVVIIAESDLSLFMPRAQKVFIPATYIFADSTLIAPAGARNIVRAALRCRKTIVAVAETFKLCPFTPFSVSGLCEMGPPATVRYSSGSLLNKVEFPNPMVDFIEAGCIRTFATNNGLVPAGAVAKTTLDLYHTAEMEVY